MDKSSIDGDMMLAHKSPWADEDSHFLQCSDKAQLSLESETMYRGKKKKAITTLRRDLQTESQDKDRGVSSAQH